MLAVPLAFWIGEVIVMRTRFAESACAVLVICVPSRRKYANVSALTGLTSGVSVPPACQLMRISPPARSTRTSSSGSATSPSAGLKSERTRTLPAPAGTATMPTMPTLFGSLPAVRNRRSSTSWLLRSALMPSLYLRWRV